MYILKIYEVKYLLWCHVIVHIYMVGNLTLLLQSFLILSSNLSLGLIIRRFNSGFYTEYITAILCYYSLLLPFHNFPLLSLSFLLSPFFIFLTSLFSQLSLFFLSLTPSSLTLFTYFSLISFPNFLLPSHYFLREQFLLITSQSKEEVSSFIAVMNLN